MSIENHKLQQTLIQLAETTVVPGLTENPDLPATWKSLTTKTIMASPVGGVQVLLAYGNIGDDVIACLSIGMPWSNFIGQYTSGFSPDHKDQLPESVAGKTSDSELVSSMYTSAYFWLRSPLWDMLKFLDNPAVKNKPLYITGMGLGGPLAQIVALDFRPGNKGPAQQRVPWVIQPPSYVFTTGNFASDDFQTYFNKTVKNSYNFRAGSQALKVDQFPVLPATDKGKQAATFAPLGEVSYVSASVPSPYYTPWEVRDSNFYLKALGGTPQPFPASKTVIPNPPSGFSQTLAFSLGEFVATTYKQALEPNNPAPVELVKSLDFCSSKIVVAFFSTSNSLTVAFRGSINYQEFLMMDANSTTAMTPYGEMITSGVNEILYSPNESAGDSTLIEQLKKNINSLKGDKKLYLAGHGFGGSLANALAADLSPSINTLSSGTESPEPTIDVDAIYTFGATYFASLNLMEKFSSSYKNVSYQIVRPGDEVATALKAQPYWKPVTNSVPLIGALETLENTDHSLSSYLALLDPHRQQP